MREVLGLDLSLTSLGWFLQDGKKKPTYGSFKTKPEDGIDLKRVLNHTKFYPEYPLVWYNEQLAQGIQWPESHQGWLGWGWNGTWKMVYHTPFYDWLLKEV